MSRYLLSYLLIVGSFAAPAGAEPDGGTADAETRTALLGLPDLYRAADDLESKEQVVERAIALGELGVARVRPLVELELKRGVGRYGATFAKRTEGAYDPEEGTLEVKQVLSTDGFPGADGELAAAREELLRLAALAERLRGPDDERPSFAETLEENEVATVRQLVHARNLQHLDREEREAVTRMNSERQSRGLAPLAIDRKLCVAAADHSIDMQTRGFFSHESPLPGKKTFGDRVARAGGRARAENIYKGGGGAGAVKAWMNSQGHREAILKPSHRRIGIGRSGGYFTALFGD